jgi:hypothetical protein
MTDARNLAGLIREVLDSSRGRGLRPTVAEADAYFSKLAKRDFTGALRRYFDHAQLQEVVAELRRFLPDLNRRVFAETRVSRLRAIAADLGTVLDARPFGSDPEIRQLRGFYVAPDGFIKRPIICVNTTTHRVGTAAAFWHEIGHHLTRRIFDESEPVELSFGTNHPEHLENASEISADLLMVLGCYPRQAAARLFDFDEQGLLSVDRLIARATGYVRSVTGYEFEPQLSGAENLYRLAGMLYVAKLRAALWTEYDI